MDLIIMECINHTNEQKLSLFSISNYTKTNLVHTNLEICLHLEHRVFKMRRLLERVFIEIHDLFSLDERSARVPHPRAVRSAGRAGSQRGPGGRDERLVSGASGKRLCRQRLPPRQQQSPQFEE
jgi:hypothetical protein